MDKNKLNAQLIQTLRSYKRFKKTLNYENSWHILAQFVFWIAFVIFMGLILNYVGLVFELVLVSSGAAKLQVLGQLSHNIWLILSHPMYLGWTGYIVIAGEVAFLFGLGWRAWRSYQIKQLYQRFESYPESLQIWQATSINLSHALIYTTPTNTKPFTAALAQLPKDKQEEWEKLTHQYQLTRWAAPRTNYDAKGIRQFMTDNFFGAYQYVDVLMSEPYSKPLYWKKDSQESWVAGIYAHERPVYFQRKYQADGKKIKISLGRKLVNAVFVMFWH